MAGAVFRLQAIELLMTFLSLYTRVWVAQTRLTHNDPSIPLELIKSAGMDNSEEWRMEFQEESNTYQYYEKDP